MSLQVWLPLNGDLHNQGLSNITITNNGATVDNSGKIGQCYSFNGNNNYLYASYNFYNSRYSVCAWIYTTSSSATQTIICDRTTVGCGFSIFLIGGKLRIDCGGNSLQWTTAYTYPINTWFHLTVTYDGNIVYYYINGEFKEKKAQTLASSYWGTTTSIGASQTNGSGYGNYLNGKLNDVRIYDHALSAKEVEEIAKGLVLHYKLDNDGMGNPNLAKNSNTDSTSSNVWTLSMATGGTTKTIIIDNGVYCVQITRNNTAQSGWRFMGYNNFDRTAIKTDTYYTASFDIKSNYAGTIDFTGLVNSNATNYMTGSDRIINCNTVYANEWSHISLTIKTISSFDNISVGSQIIYFAPSDGIYTTGNVILLKNIKLEEGKIDTYWIPNKSDALYSLYATNDTIVYDSSGYGNNGIITGNLTTDSNSIRYGVTTVFPSGGYIRVEKRPATCLPKEALTVNLWQYSTSWSNPISCTEGGGWNFENSSGIRFPVYISGVGYKVAQSSITPASLNNAWHMLTGTMDKNNIKIYIDGEEAGTVTTGSTNGIGYANNYLFISGEASGNSVTPANSNYTGKLSDVRIYATALTPEQIKELYNTSMSIDNNGNIHARELIVEDTNNISTNKRGQLLVNTAEEDAIIASFIKPNEIKCDNLYEY